MPIPDERPPQVDETGEPAVESAVPEMLDEEEELEFESSDADTADDVIEDDEAGEPDTASFGYGDPAD